MKAINRVKQYIDYKEINHSTFEKKIGISNGYISTQLKREADLGEGILVKILDNCPDLNPKWLLTGKGSMLLKNDTSDIINEDDMIYKNTSLTDEIVFLKSILKEKHYIIDAFIDMIETQKKVINSLKKINDNISNR